MSTLTQRKAETTAKQDALCHDTLKSLLSYHPETGVFTWNRTGRRAGFFICNGKYWGVGICGHTYKASRLAWFYVNGVWPLNLIDHIDGYRFNDAIANLRDVSYLGNSHNLTRHRNGYLVGTTLDKRIKKGKVWMAGIKSKGKTRTLGYFHTQQEAHARYMEEISK